MNIYDFDKTIYNGDSSIDFYMFALKKNKLLIRYLPIQLYGAIMYLLNIYTKEQFKEKFFGFIKGIRDIDNTVEMFWDQNTYKIKKWYLEKQKDTDVVISASPYFLLKDICNRLSINNLIASDVDKKTGKFISLNCYGEEKVKRFKEKYKDEIIEEFFSDSLSDTPLSKLAKISYIVKGNEILEWESYTSKQSKKSIWTQFLSKQFLQFLFIGGINTVNGVLLAYLYSFKLQPNIAFILGYATSLLISYLLNSYIVFRNKLSIYRFIKFAIAYIPNFIIQNIIVIIFFNMLGFHRLVVYFIAAIIGVPITFIVLKFFTFKNKNADGIN